MPFLVKQNVMAPNVNGDSFSHMEGSVISDWELSDFIRGKVNEGSQYYRDRFEPLLEHEAHNYRVKATAAEGLRPGPDGSAVEPPFDDYVGLHPTEVTDRMRDLDLDDVKKVKLYESLGMNRDTIIHFVSPAEREPFPEYDQRSVEEVLEKFSVLSDPAVADAIAYERSHKNRPAIVSYDRRVYEGDKAHAATA